MSAGAASAAAPANDVSGSALAIGALPFSTTLDTSEATTDADDAELNPVDCGAPATDASVWFTFTAATDGVIVADVGGSDYSAGVSAGEGTTGSLTFLACGPGGTAFPVVAGETYTILAFDDQLDGTGNGGLLDITVETAPDVPTIEATVNPVATFDKATGGAIVSGTATCSGVADFAFVDVELTQRVGRLLIRGFGGAEIACTGSVEPWNAFVLGDNGLFKGGKGATATVAAACNISGCGEYLTDQTIQLKGRTR